MGQRETPANELRMIHIFHASHGDVVVDDMADVFASRLYTTLVSEPRMPEKVKARFKEVCDKYEAKSLALHGDVSLQWDGPRDAA